MLSLVDFSFRLALCSFVRLLKDSLDGLTHAEEMIEVQLFTGASSSWKLLVMILSRTAVRSFNKIPARSLSTSLFAHTTGSPVSSPRPVVFLHGLLGSSTNFRSIQSVIAKSRVTSAFDLRNHGKSFHSPETMTMQCLAEDVRRTIGSIWPDAGPVDIVGHSLGGKVAMQLALEYPELVNTMVVVDIAPITYDVHNASWRDVNAIVHGMLNLDVGFCKNRAEVDAALSKFVADPGVRSFAAQNLITTSEGKYAWRVNLKSIIDSMPELSTFAFPDGVQSKRPLAAENHFIAGERSGFLTKQHIPIIEEFFPRTMHHTIPKAGHWVHADNYPAFMETLTKVLEVPHI